MQKKDRKTTDSLDARMKRHEAVTDTMLTPGVPKVVRLDMRAGHTFCRGFAKPFDEVFSDSMIAAAKTLCAEVPGAVCAYVQSDEISLILNDITERGKQSCFFDGRVEKICSVTASICTLAFQRAYQEAVAQHGDLDGIYSRNFWKGQFDSRVFCLPGVTELHNYLVWRQQDASRNSVQMAAHAYFTDKECHDKDNSQLQDMLMLERGINWSNYPARYKRGTIIAKECYEKDVELPDGSILRGVKRTRWTEAEIPILTADTSFVPKLYARWLLVNGVLIEPEKKGESR